MEGVWTYINVQRYVEWTHSMRMFHLSMHVKQIPNIGMSHVRKWTMRFFKTGARRFGILHGVHNPSYHRYLEAQCKSWMPGSPSNPYISSQSCLQPLLYMQHVRGHWGTRLRNWGMWPNNGMPINFFSLHGQHLISCGLVTFPPMTLALIRMQNPTLNSSEDHGLTMVVCHVMKPHIKSTLLWLCVHK